MKSTFKPILFTAILTFSAFLVVVYTSCSKPDKCKAIACANGGVCIDGVCKCLPGYQGPNCDTVSRDQFIGLYEVTETGTVTTISRNYAIALEADPADVTAVRIKNLYNYFFPQFVKGVIDGDTITIPNQQLMGKVVFGKGYIYYTPQYGSGPVAAISMRYEVIDTAAGAHTAGKVDDFGYYSELDGSKPSNWAKGR